MAALDPRLIALWTGPVALVKAAAAAGAQTHFSGMGGRTVVTFPVPGVADATVKATLSARHQAEHVETRLGDGTLIQTTYANYTELNGADLRERLRDSGTTPAPSSPEQFGIYLREEIARWSTVIREKGLKGE